MADLAKRNLDEVIELDRHIRVSIVLRKQVDESCLLRVEHATWRPGPRQRGSLRPKQAQVTAEYLPL